VEFIPPSPHCLNNMVALLSLSGSGYFYPALSLLLAWSMRTVYRRPFSTSRSKQQDTCAVEQVVVALVCRQVHVCVTCPAPSKQRVVSVAPHPLPFGSCFPPMCVLFGVTRLVYNVTSRHVVERDMRRRHPWRPRRAHVSFYEMISIFIFQDTEV